MTTASAPAKAILLGEHTALYKNPVLVMALDRRAYAEVSRRDDGQVILTAPDLGLEKAPIERHRRGTALVRKAVESVGGGGWDIEVRSDIPIASGLGSSAAISAALIMALRAELRQDTGVKEIAEASWECEHVVHSKSSGVDPFAVSYGGLSVYQDGGIEALDADDCPKVVAAHCGKDSDTWEIVEDVDRERERKPERFAKFLKLCGMLVEDGRRAVMEGDWRKLGGLMNDNHEALKGIGVSCRELDDFVEAARGSGAMGAKLTGAGRGGVVIALVDEYSKWNVHKTLSKMGGKIMEADVSEEGVRLE